MRDTDSPYDDNFYTVSMPGMSRSASVVLGLLFAHYRPVSVVDIGCGRGAWLAAAEKLGATSLRGLDGAWVGRDVLLSDAIEFSAVDFEGDLPPLAAKYDLCISLEVAEHISQGNAKRFIDYLCHASDVILFGGAIKYQGGTNHLNEQWQSYWMDLFSQNGFQCLDVVRPHVWNNTSVEWWYRQNTFLFINSNSGSAPDEENLRRLEKPIADIVHPENFESKIRSFKRQLEYPSLRLCWQCVTRYARNKIQRKYANRSRR
jgi:hypothetical protein